MRCPTKRIHSRWDGGGEWAWATINIVSTTQQREVNYVRTEKCCSDPVNERACTVASDISYVHEDNTDSSSLDGPRHTNKTRDKKRLANVYQAASPK